MPARRDDPARGGSPGRRERRSSSPVVLLCLGAAAAVLALACTAEPRRDRRSRPLGEVIARGSDTTSLPATTHDADTADQSHLARLEREARTLIRTNGCPTADRCRSAPVGWRGCGGPRTYLVYCAATTDTVALYSKLQELEMAERDYNARSGIASTCESRQQPGVRVSGQRCREAPAAAAPGPR
jgi:hypothetical protein